jgi:hypothetical protein
MWSGGMCDRKCDKPKKRSQGRNSMISREPLDGSSRSRRRWIERLKAVQNDSGMTRFGGELSEICPKCEKSMF